MEKAFRKYPNAASLPNTDVHFHLCVVDWVFEALPNALAVNFHVAMGLDEAAMAQVQADVRRRILRAFVARGHLEACDAKDMAAYAHGGGQGWSACCVTAPGHRSPLNRLIFLGESACRLRVNTYFEDAIR